MPKAFKTFTDIRFFLKNAETTAAFTTPFTGSGAEVIYPNENFNNTSPIDLISLAQNNQVVFPILLGAVNTFSTTNVTSGTAGAFNSVEAGDTILYRTSAEDNGSLKVLGQVAAFVSGTQITLTKNAPITGTTQIAYRFPKNNNTVSFNPADNFYMVVKNPDYTAGLHDAVLNIDTSASFTTSITFAYGFTKTLVSTYFTIQRISKEGIPDEREATPVSIACTIKGISSFSEPSMFPTTTIPTDSIPYWSVYEINPLGESNENLRKNTIYGINVVTNSLPAAQVVANTSVPAPGGGDTGTP
jgi:hypothetical protein